MTLSLRAWAGAGLAASVLALAACGGGSDDAAAPVAGADAAATGAPNATAPAPGAGGGAGATPGAPGAPGVGDPQAAAPDRRPGGATTGPTRAGLRAATQAYANALLKGNFIAVVPLLDSSCTAKDRDALAGALGIVKGMAQGATMRITGVRLVGNVGAPTRYKLSAKATPQLRAVVKQAFLASGGTNPWRFVDGRWVNTGPCSGAGQEGTPT